MVDRLTDAELLELRRLNTLAQEAAFAVETTTTAARRAQLALQNYVYQLEADHGLLGKNPQLNIQSGEIKGQEEPEEAS